MIGYIEMDPTTCLTLMPVIERLIYECSYSDLKAMRNINRLMKNAIDLHLTQKDFLVHLVGKTEYPDIKDIKQIVNTTIVEHLITNKMFEWLLEWVKQNSHIWDDIPVDHLRKLVWLHLSHMKLTTIPSEIGVLCNLTNLYINNNQLTSVPHELGDLHNLVVLRLDVNKLTTIPSELGNLTNLERLDLDQNQLISLPIEIARLSKLRILYLDYNKLTT
jgi:Leucine-rich repeat (LRR) protein